MVKIATQLWIIFYKINISDFTLILMKYLQNGPNNFLHSMFEEQNAITVHFNSVFDLSSYYSYNFIKTINNRIFVDPILVECPEIYYIL